MPACASSSGICLMESFASRLNKWIQRSGAEDALVISPKLLQNYQYPPSAAELIEKYRNAPQLVPTGVARFVPS